MVVYSPSHKAFLFCFYCGLFIAPRDHIHIACFHEMLKCTSCAAAPVLKCCRHVCVCVSVCLVTRVMFFTVTAAKERQTKRAQTTERLDMREAIWGSLTLHSAAPQVDRDIGMSHFMGRRQPMGTHQDAEDTSTGIRATFIYLGV